MRARERGTRGWREGSEGVLVVEGEKEGEEERAARNVDQPVNKSLHLVSRNHSDSHSASTQASKLTPPVLLVLKIHL